MRTALSSGGPADVRAMRGQTHCEESVRSHPKIVQQLPGSGGTCSERWDGDRLTFRATAIGQTVDGVIDVLDAAVTIEIQVRGVLGMAASGLKDRLQNMGQLLLTKK